MQGLMRIVCLGYLASLTILLMVADPLRLLGIRGDAASLLRSLMPVAHMLGFSMLALLGLAARWPVPRWGIALFLMFYAGMTEIAQSFLPPRSAELLDWLQDLAGIAVGAVLCWIVARIVGALVKPFQKAPECSPRSASNNFEIAQSVLSRSTPHKESWWG